MDRECLLKSAKRSLGELRPKAEAIQDGVKSEGPTARSNERSRDTLGVAGVVGNRRGLVGVGFGGVSRVQARAVIAVSGAGP